VISQAGILGPVPQHGRCLMFSYVGNATEIDDALALLADVVVEDDSVVGLGPALVKAAGADIAGLRVAPAMVGPGFDVPSTPYALWIWLRGSDRGELFHRSREMEHGLAMEFELKEVLDTFMHNDSRDLSGYVDGTENPQDDAAVAAAIVQNQGDGLDGASFVAVQQWQHDFDALDEMTESEQDNAIGRRISDNEELNDAPKSAHVKRTAQESFDPEAFMLRRSMPWTEGNEAGLNFVAFGKSLDPFEVMLARMVGQEDGIVDALFGFSRPVTSAYFWCPPMKNGKLDLSAIASSRCAE